MLFGSDWVLLFATLFSVDGNLLDMRFANLENSFDIPQIDLVFLVSPGNTYETNIL